MVLVEVCLNLSGEFVGINKENALIIAQVEVTYKNGAVCNVAGGTQICGPCYIIESGEKDSIGEFALCSLQDSGYFRVNGLTYNLLIVNE